MRNRFRIICLSLVFVLMACNKDKEIRLLLTSKKTTSRCQGAWEAGETGNKEYIPLLLKNANDASASTSLRFKGFTVYTETMYALERISHLKPPHPYGGILIPPDTDNIRFYSSLWHKMNDK
jgi:hypothetical protein